ncbi:hypothetical protein D3C87_1842480 [compost metagenome]
MIGPGIKRDDVIGLEALGHEGPIVFLAGGEDVELQQARGDGDIAGNGRIQPQGAGIEHEGLFIGARNHR